MKTQYHLEITAKALSPHFSDRAMEIILAANTGQDKIRYQLGRHNHFHFDGSAFDEGFAYITQQESQITQLLSQGDCVSAQQAFGRLTHSWQDFYSHSNYVQLWHEASPDMPAESIDPADTSIFSDPRLKSGRNLLLLEYLNMIPWIAKLLNPLMPLDSHARMNLDTPDAGEFFSFAYAAALHQTRAVYENLILKLHQEGFTQSEISAFRGQTIQY